MTAQYQIFCEFIAHVTTNIPIYGISNSYLWDDIKIGDKSRLQNDGYIRSVE